MNSDFSDLFPPYNPAVSVSATNETVQQPIVQQQDQLITKTAPGASLLSASNQSGPAKPTHQKQFSITNQVVPDLTHIGASDFETLKLLGIGDVGKVYLVHLHGYPDNEQLYAMKVLNRAEIESRNKMRRLSTEKQILQSAHHPFIVTLYAYFEDNEQLYLLMEYCPGGEFFRVLQEQPHKCLPESAAKFYAAEVLSAFSYLHSIGVVYRDLKPENLLIHKSGHLRLTDFDLSIICDKNIDEPKNTNPFRRLLNKKDEEDIRMHQFHSFVGTPEYIAPEVITGFGYGPTVDWWTLGILLFEMLFGYTPFRGNDNDETFQHILHANVQIPDSNIYGPISNECKQLLKKLIQSDPSKRLGHKHGAADIKAHDFFKGVDFDNLVKEIPPIRPAIKDIFDTTRFNGAFSEDNDEEEEIVEVVNNVDDLDKM